MGAFGVDLLRNSLLRVCEQCAHIKAVLVTTLWYAGAQVSKFILFGADPFETIKRSRIMETPLLFGWFEKSTERFLIRGKRSPAGVVKLELDNEPAV